MTENPVSPWTYLQHASFTSFHLPLSPKEKKKKKGEPKIKYGKVNSCRSCWDAVGFTPEQASPAFLLLLSFVRSPACHLCQLHIRTLAHLYVEGIWGDASMSHRWEHVEPSLWAGPARAVHGSSTVAGWSSHAWGVGVGGLLESVLSKDTPILTVPLYFMHGRDILILLLDPFGHKWHCGRNTSLCLWL